jgi:hypothetical protein
VAVLSYAELLERTDRPVGSTWGLFGDGDELGMLNHLTPDRVARAAGLVRKGTVFNLDLPVGAFDPPLLHRTPPKHTIFGHGAYHRDDTLDGLYLQGSTQIDGLRHFAHPKHGFYNGTPESQIRPGNPTLGVNRAAEHGIVGRGVLLDVATQLGDSLDHRKRTAFTVRDLDSTADAQGVRLEPGDIVLIRTGWLGFVFGLDRSERLGLPHDVRSTGLAQSEDTLRWIWEHQLALLAADNLAVEVMPPVPTSPHFTDPELSELQGIHRGMAHPVLIGLLGLTLGELWSLDELAEDCRRDGVWECLLSAHPLNVTGGVGSPANAFAIK